MTTDRIRPDQIDPLIANLTAEGQPSRADVVRRCRETIEALQAERERLREVLREVQWAGCDSVWHESCCPWCERHRPECTCDGCSAYTYAHRHKGHTADCEIAAVLGDGQ